MIDFKHYITEEKNTHMTHIQDLVLYRGVNGTRQAINALRSIRDDLSGKSSGGTSITMKYSQRILRYTPPMKRSTLTSPQAI
jgi:hypothetical protein